MQFSLETLPQPQMVSVLSPPMVTAAQPRTVLLISTSWWAFTARVALRFAALGWRVEASCPPGHPLRKTSAVQRLHAYSALRPLSALQATIAAVRPDLIVPCDDRSVTHLHGLYDHLRGSDAPDAYETANLIARSLGRADGFAATEQRSELIRIAREEGLRAPDTRAVDSADALRAALAEIWLPALLKVDGSWGGLGTVLVRNTAEAEHYRATLARRLNAVRAFKRLLFDRDPYHVLPWLTQAAPRVNVQAFIAGRPANSIAACWNGEVLASVSAEVMCAHRELGPSTVVRIIEHPEMARTTERLVRRLGLSGFCGFDFMIEEGTGHAHLIEMNPRGTPLCHLAFGAGRDPIGALVARVQGTPPPAAEPMTGNPVIAFFPQAWLSDPTSPFLQAGYHDVPWEDPGLLQELLRLPYPDRGLLARLLVRLRRMRRRAA